MCIRDSCWIFYQAISDFLLDPIMGTISRYDQKLKPIDIMEPFWVRTQVSLVCGLFLSLPLLLLELWGFVRPGLTPRERRVIRVLPFAVVLLFLLGLAFGYWMCGVFVSWFLSDYFVTPNMEPELRVQSTVLFVAKVLFAFGLGFQIPVVMVALNRVGILPSSLLSKRWREAAMAIFTCAAIITPTWDPLSMVLAAMPLTVLYLATLGVIKLLERGDRKRAKRAAAEEFSDGQQ